MSTELITLISALVGLVAAIISLIKNYINSKEIKNINTKIDIIKTNQGSFTGIHSENSTVVARDNQFINNQ